MFENLTRAGSLVAAPSDDVSGALLATPLSCDIDSTDDIAINRRDRWICLSADAVTAILCNRLQTTGEDATAIGEIVAAALRPEGSLEALAPLLSAAWRGEFALASKTDDRLILHFSLTDDAKVFVVRYLNALITGDL